ncbi:MAG TPA: NDP-sugar synthase [Candidatus Baltobacteraceae bacterium]|jgi:NDP-sugar pyrophosphorylase family protein|nr:NDP-sugar synthase [Candidatus Baltobacteraceae bacterium]
MILAGGLSTRLYPLTKQVPKPLVPVGGAPNAVHLIRYLKSYGFDEIIINVHYLADAITRTLGDGSKFGVRLEYSHEPELLGSAGGVKQVQRFFGDEEFVVVGCDDLTDLALDKLLEMHRSKRAIATIGLVEREKVDQYGVVVVDSDGRITGFQEKPAIGTERSKLVNTGIYAFSPEIFARIPSSRFYDFGKEVFPELQAAGAAFYGFDSKSAYWCDIGTPDEYRRASADLVNGAFAIPKTRASGADPSAQIAASATVDANVWIGAGASIGRNVRIAGPSVIGDGVRIEDDAVLERSIVWEGATVERGATLRDTIVGANYTVRAGASLEGAVVANEAAVV